MSNNKDTRSRRACATLAAATALLAGCGGLPPKAVRYEVVGDSGQAGNVTYSSAGGSMEQEVNVKLPWFSEQTFPAVSADVAVITAQNGPQGKITCRVLVNGEKVVEKTSTGAYAVAACTVPPF